MSLTQAQAPVSTESPVSHPTPCPSWCVDRHAPMAHHFGPTSTTHSSPTISVKNRRTVSTELTSFISAELYRLDEGDEIDHVRLWVSGGTDGDLSRDEADMLINDLQAFVDNLRVLRRQMG